MKQGVLVYDQKSERMDVRFGLEDYYGGLHCGTCMDVFVNNRWKPTRIEYGWDERGWTALLSILPEVAEAAIVRLICGINSFAQNRTLQSF